MRVAVTALLALNLMLGCKGSVKPKPRATVAIASAVSSSSWPGKPPSDAKDLACGGSWTLVRQGKQPGPEAPRQLVAGIRVWDARGKQIFNSARNPHGMVVGLEPLPPALREMIRLTGMGGVARAWLPPAAMEGWKPHAFPNEELLYEIDVMGDLPPPINEVQEISGSVSPALASAVAAVAAAPPDLSGPPRAASETPTGLKFVVLTPGDGAHPRPDERVHVLADAWVAKGLTVEQAVKQHPVTVTSRAAPAGLGDVLAQLGTGGRARVWVPAAKAESVFPQQKGQALVVDLTLQHIDSL